MPAVPHRYLISASDSLRAGSHGHVDRDPRGQMPDLIKQAGGVCGSAEVLIYRRTKGRRAGSVRGTAVLLLTTTGRKSGARRADLWGTSRTGAVSGVGDGGGRCGSTRMCGHDTLRPTPGYAG